MNFSRIPDITISPCEFVEFEIQNIKDPSQNQQFQMKAHSDVLDVVSIVIGSKRRDLTIKSVQSKTVELIFNRKQFKVVCK